MTKRLFHYTALIHLGEIFRDGITEGEMPLDWTVFKTYESCPKAVNLTTNANRDDQIRIWAQHNPADKTRIRLTVELPEESCFSFRKLREMYHIPEKILKALAPYEERKYWFFHQGVIPPERIVSVEMFSDGEYRVLSSEKLALVITAIDAEVKRAFTVSTVTDGMQKGARSMKLNKDCEESWLLDLEFPDALPFTVE